ncbi:MAG: AAA family ATPase [Opitutales bacterium]|nr:AAA family ATPase [Opitutales bacterium]
MKADAIYFRRHRCFKNDWAGFDTIKPINVIIGRNNSGKSHLLDLVEGMSSGNLKGRGWSLKLYGVLDENSLKQVFREGTSGGEMRGSWWIEHGKHFIDVNVDWETDENLNPKSLNFPPDFDFESRYGRRSTDARISEIKNLIRNATYPLSGTLFRRLLADRDIKPESPNLQLLLAPDGTGASNIIRRYIVTANPKYPRELIQRDLLTALNKIFGSDGQFTEIQVKIHDDSKTGIPEGYWEVYLGEEKKGLIPLSNSGSGLKTVFLVLLNLLVVPRIEEKKPSDFTFAFEELENNLHPALLRRLFQYLEEYAVKESAPVFLTTHSSTALDLFGVSENTQIIHVTHDGDSARATTVSAHFDHLGVISELGAKPSDLLQANGIIWVEGPSDCIYINRWIDLFSEGELQEGRDYQCAFYGGSLLARTQFKSPEEAEKEVVNLFRVNPNIVVVCDGDRTAKGKRVKDRVRRIRAQVNQIPGAHIWVTEAREIENYIPGEVLTKAVGTASLPDPMQYEAFFPRKGSPGSSYIESRIGRKGFDKMDLAILCVPSMETPMMSRRFEWEAQMKKIVERINAWNR